MAKSQQTFNKSEKEKKRLKKREDKRKKMEARKAEAKETGKKGIEFAYVDHFGNLTDTPPDPSEKLKVDIESIDNLFKQEQFDVVCNLAAQAGVRYSIENPKAYIDSNRVR